MKKTNNKKGFTIVELVIVIAVIAILAAVLIPTFSSVINKANESAALQEAQNAIKVVTAEYAAKGESVSEATIYIFEDDVTTDNLANNEIEYTVPYNGSLSDPVEATENNKIFEYTSGTCYAGVEVTVDGSATPAVKTTVLTDLGKNIVVVVTSPVATAG